MCAGVEVYGKMVVGGGAMSADLAERISLRRWVRYVIVFCASEVVVVGCGEQGDFGNGLLCFGGLFKVYSAFWRCCRSEVSCGK